MVFHVSWWACAQLVFLTGKPYPPGRQVEYTRVRVRVGVHLPATFKTNLISAQTGKNWPRYSTWLSIWTDTEAGRHHSRGTLTAFWAWFFAYMTWTWCLPNIYYIKYPVESRIGTILYEKERDLPCWWHFPYRVWKHSQSMSCRRCPDAALSKIFHVWEYKWCNRL
jgi:hypothetical protein